ncbi:MAG: FadR family transcriptional regulator [Planctomycetaceae bacterium]|nr:FadR family transcriptional regulator [Planctomycetaceae bacterium]
MPTIDLVERVANELEQKILGGEIGPGQRLPPERALGTQLGVSRSVVREAIKRLQSLGLVASVQGSGTRVERPSRKPLRLSLERLVRAGDVSINDIWAVRIPLETAIAVMAAERRTDEHLRELESLQEVLQDPNTSVDDRARADANFHATLAEATGNCLFSIVLAPLIELMTESKRQTIGAYGSESAYTHHAKILDAVRRQDVHAAEEAMQEHLSTNYEYLRELAGATT